MFSSTTITTNAPPGWTTYTRKKTAPTPPPTPPPAFEMELDIPTSTVTITSADAKVTVWVELNAPLKDGRPSRDGGIVHVEAASGQSGKPFDLSVTLEPFRKEGIKTSLGISHCQPRFEHEDEVVNADDSLLWYHWNHNGTTYQNDTLRAQGVDPAAAGLADIFTHRAFGAKVSAAGLTPSSKLQLTGHGLTKVDVVVAMLTLAPADAPDASSWLKAIATVTSSATAARDGSCPGRGGAAATGRDCATDWSEIMERGYIELTAPAGKNDTVPKQITDHINYDRYLSLIQGRAAFGPIKFNGQMFNANLTGKGWDTRSWGAGTVYTIYTLYYTHTLYSILGGRYSIHHNYTLLYSHSILNTGGRVLVAERAAAVLQCARSGGHRHHALVPGEGV
jgi:hypothetical protein